MIVLLPCQRKIRQQESSHTFDCMVESYRKLRCLEQDKGTVMRSKVLPIIPLVFVLAACVSSKSNSTSSQGTAQQPPFVCSSASVAKFIASQTSGSSSERSRSNSAISATFQHMHM